MSIALFLVLLLMVYGANTAKVASTSNEQYVYYGYVPSSTNTGGLPPGFAYLDIVGMADGTTVEIWDILARLKLASVKINKLENYTYPIRVLTYFKLVSNKPVSAVLYGGSYISPGSPGESRGGVTSLYPSVGGGFAGKEFIFEALHRSDSPWGGLQLGIGGNCFIIALEETTVNIVDSSGKVAYGDLKLKQGEYKQLFLSNRFSTLVIAGAGETWFFRATSTGTIMISSEQYSAIVPLQAVGGGYVGKLFVGVTGYPHIENPPPNTYGAFAVFPYEPGLVKVYKTDGTIVAEKSFTAEDVAQGRYWFETFNYKYVLLFSSTGRISVMTGGTREGTTIDYMGDDIALAGVKRNEELRFYAPTEAVIFAPKELDLTVDGRTIHRLKDEFYTIDRGFHLIKASETAIVQIIGEGGAGWLDWGAYLISPRDVEYTYTVPPGFGEFKTRFPYEYAVAGAAVAGTVVIILKRRLGKRSKKPERL